MSVEYKESRTVDKSAWPRGVWDQEPDKVQWQDETTGLPCLAVRQTSFGHWCGYVGVAEGHPAFGRDYNHVAVDCHGGLTYASPCQGDVCHDALGHDHVWWLGFDCAHGGDHSPGMKFNLERGESYKPLAYVTAECAALAAQLQAMHP